LAEALEIPDVEKAIKESAKVAEVPEEADFESLA